MVSMGSKHEFSASESSELLITTMRSSASPELPVSWLLLSSNFSFPDVWLSGLWGPFRGSGETALEVLGLGCSVELRDNLASFSSLDSILIIFLWHSVWQDFLLFCGVAVLEASSPQEGSLME